MMLHKPPAAVDTPCPTAAEWHDALRGRTSHQRWSEIETHLQACPACEATVDALTELSDTCIRQLCHGPSTVDDEPVFQVLYSKLLNSAELAAADARDADSAFRLPRRLGNYELLSPLGQGANGSVFLARHVPLDRQVVVKLLKPNQDFDPASVDRFVQEVRTVGRLDHPNIVRATDAGETDNQHFLVMEYVPGLDLSSVLAACGPLRVCDVCEIIRQAALGLACLHDNGFVHRDVKPSNLLLTADGQTKLMDLGLVHYVNDRSVPQHGDPQPPHGTADYMSPEQWLDFDRVGYRSDLYSLGCSLCKLLTGLPPFRPLPSGFATKSAAHCDAPIPKLRAQRADVSDALQKLFDRLLAKRPEDRFASAQELAGQLLPLTRGSDLRSLAVRAGLPTTSQADAAQPRRFRRWNRRNAMLATMLAASVLIITGRLASHVFVREASLTKYLETDSWRSLSPTPSPLLVSLDDSDTQSLFHIEADAIQICSNKLVLLNLGQPVVGTFQLAVDLASPIGHYSAGLFFRFVEEQHSGRLIQRCQTIEYVPDGDGDGEARENKARLVWCALRIDKGNDPGVTRQLLADMEVPRAEEEALLQVGLGADGYPSVVWCGQPQPLDRWRTLSYEAREGAAAPRQRREAGFPGQIGILAGTEEPAADARQHPGTTEFRHPRLRYQTR